MEDYARLYLNTARSHWSHHEGTEFCETDHKAGAPGKYWYYSGKTPIKNLKP